MATRARDRNEKRGASPSSAPPHTQRRPSPNPPKVDKSLPSATTSRRPTASTPLDASKQQGKKPGSVSEKPVIDRRRSFDRPPSALPTSSSVMRTNSGNPLRSSSFSGKSSTTQKMVSQKNLRGATKDVEKQQGIYTRPVGVAKKSGAAVKKRELGGGSDSETERNGNQIEKLEVSSVTDASEPENLSDNQESPVKAVEIDGEDTGIRDLPPENDENVAAVDPAEAADQIHTNLDDNTAIGAPIENEESSTLPIEHREDEEPKGMTIHENLIEENDEKPVEEEDTEITAKPETDANQETEPQDAEEKVIEKNVNSSDSDAPSKAAAEEIRSAEAQDAEEKAIEKNVKPGDGDVPPKTAAEEIRRGKRETMAPEPAVSNDVIEETAKQLREQRKNRVRALAGAFETVISMQDPK